MTISHNRFLKHQYNVLLLTTLYTAKKYNKTDIHSITKESIKTKETDLCWLNMI